MLFRSLQRAVALVQDGVREPGRIEQEMQEMIRAAPEAELDYARVVDRWTLEPVASMERDVLVAVAVRFGKTRLIDNWIIPAAK